MLEESFSRLSLGSEWEEYTHEAEKEIGVSPLYFQLPLYRIGAYPPRNITPAYRYLEVLTERYLTEESSARLNRVSGDILGIYESLAGVREGLLRNKPEITLYFAQRLRPESKEILIKELREGKIGPINPFATRALRELSTFLSLNVPHAFPWQEYTEKMVEEDRFPDISRYPGIAEYEKALYYLISLGSSKALEEALLVPTNIEEIFLSTLRSGRTELVNKVLYMRKELGLPSYGEKVEDIVKTPLLTLPDELPPLSSVPRPGRVPNYYFSAALYGGNPRLYDFLLALQGGKDPSSLNEEEFFLGYYAKRGLSICLEEICFYQLLARLPSRLITSNFALDIDLAILGFAKGLSPLSIAEKNLGNVDILLAFLPYINKEELLPLTQGYPLTRLVLSSRG